MEDQLLETYKYAAEEVRSLREHEWTVTNYTVLAYAGLAAIPYALLAAIQHAELGAILHEERWRNWICVLLVSLVLLVEYQALRTLWFTNDLVDTAGARLAEAVHRLPSVCDIHRLDRPTQPPKRPWWVRLPSYVRSPSLLWSSEPKEQLRPCPEEVIDPGTGEAAQVTGPGLRVRPGLVTVVVAGAFLAGLIIVTTIPSVVFRRVMLGALWGMIASVILVIAGHMLGAW